MLSRSLRRPRAVIVAVAGLTVTALALAGCAFVPGLFDGGRVDTVGTVAFGTPLAIPPLAESTVEPDGTRVFALTAQEGSTSFAPGTSTPTMGYDAAYLGPTIRAARGERVRVDLRNDLDAPTTLHWHGMHLPAKIDGGPHQMVARGATWSPEWTIDQPAATLWYHPHPHETTEGQMRRGLAGLFVIDDPADAALGLPSQYGVDDVPLIVQDQRIDDTGRMTDKRGFVGLLGDQVVVNGTVGGVLDVTTETVRLRMLNASTARVYDFRFSDGRGFDQIASDGGLLEAPVPLDHVRLSPGERAEIVVRSTPGESVVLRSETPELGTEGGVGDRNGGADRFDVLELRAAPSLVANAPKPLPARLATIERLDAAGADGDAPEIATTREISLDGFAINGEPMRMDRIDAVVTLGTTERWRVVNDMDLPHNFHVHDVQFQVATIDGAPPPPELAGWKDTVYLPPHVTFELLMRFEDYADPSHPYMYHCHLLWHEDQGMMHQFVVVEPGQEGTVPATIDGGDPHEH